MAEETAEVTEAAEATEAAPEQTNMERAQEALASYFGDNEPDPPETVEEGEETEAPEEAAEEVAEEEPPPIAAEEAEEAQTPQLAAIARREKHQRQQHERRLAEIKGKEEAINKAYGELNEFKGLLENVRNDPAAFFRRLGYDHLDGIASKLYAAELGEDAPAEMRQQNEWDTMRSEMRALREENQRFQQQYQLQLQQQEAKRAIAQYQQSIYEYADNVTDDYPLVHAFMAVEPAETKKLMYQLTQENAKADPNGQVMTPEQIVVALEENLQPQKEAIKTLYELIFGVKAKPESEEKPKPKRASKTLTNSQTATQTNRRKRALTPEERVQRALDAWEELEGAEAG